MAEGLCAIMTGQPNGLHNHLYKTWADAGFAMSISGHYTIAKKEIRSIRERSLTIDYHLGNVNISRSHLGTPGDLRVPSELDETSLRSWRKLAKAMTSNDTIGILQLVHTGRQSVRCAGRLPWTPPLAPSAIRISTNPKSRIANFVERAVFQTPKEMDQRDIDHVTHLFVRGAEMARRAGFHGVELHARYGSSDVWAALASAKVGLVSVMGICCRPF